MSSMFPILLQDNANVTLSSINVVGGSTSPANINIEKYSTGIVLKSTNTNDGGKIAYINVNVSY